MMHVKVITSFEKDKSTTKLLIIIIINLLKTRNNRWAVSEIIKHMRTFLNYDINDRLCTTDNDLG